ncbi:hypothetical protein EV43_15045, partial [Staphylococcus aureus]
MIRGSTPGIVLVSPLPRYDVYSFEDLAQLIQDLKNAYKDADIVVKLGSKTRVDTTSSGNSEEFGVNI